MTTAYMSRLYHYVGPDEIRNRNMGAPGGRAIRSLSELLDWMRETNQSPDRQGLIGATFVVDHSTGFCPEPESWVDVAGALERIPIAHPNRFTQVIVFRRCPQCCQRNIVKDCCYFCGVCGGALPAEWNFV